MRLCKYYILFLTLCFTSTYAKSTSGGKLQFSGFGELSLISHNSEVYGYREDVSYDDGVFNNDIGFNGKLGLQLDYSLTPNLDIVYQALYRDQKLIDFEKLSNLAFLKYTPSAAWSYKLGRIPLDLFLLTEFRDIGFAYNWANPPSEVYALVPNRNLDGFDISYQTYFSRLILRTKFYAGESKAEVASYGFNEEVRIDNIFGLSLNLESTNWSIQSRITRAKVGELADSILQTINALTTFSQFAPNFELIWPNLPDTISLINTENRSIRYFTLGGRYVFGNWEAIGELTQTYSSTDVVPKLNGGYISLNYYKNDHSLYGTLAWTDSKNFDSNQLSVNLNTLNLIEGGLQIYQAVNFNLNFYASSQSTISFGWRWNVTENIAIKSQWNHTKIDEMGGTLWLSQQLGQTQKESIDTFQFNLSFTF